MSARSISRLSRRRTVAPTRYSEDWRHAFLNYRSHRKIVVIDGKIGYVGGLNLDKEQLPGGNRLGSWRVSHLDRGRSRAGAAGLLAVNWYNTTGKNSMPRPISPKWISARCDHLHADYTGRPDSQWKAMQQLYFFMIMTAERKVRSNRPFLFRMKACSKRSRLSPVGSSGGDHGVQARYGTRAAHRAPFTYLADVVRSGAKVYLYNKGYFHSKTINIDSQVCAIGTANFDIRSFSINYEAMAVLYDKDLAVELAADFENDLKSCEEFSLEVYQASLWRRLLNSTARQRSPIL